MGAASETSATFRGSADLRELPPDDDIRVSPNGSSIAPSTGGSVFSEIPASATSSVSSAVAAFDSPRPKYFV
jgi:hypothetical protein